MTGKHIVHLIFMEEISPSIKALPSASPAVFMPQMSTIGRSSLMALIRLHPLPYMSNSSFVRYCMDYHQITHCTSNQSIMMEKLMAEGEQIAREQST